MGCQAGVETSKLTTVMKDKKAESTKSYDTIKLGIDAHSKWYYVARQLDGATPQPVQKMELDGLLHFVAKQQKLAGEVHTTPDYEAGAGGLRGFGYYLHRKLEAMGVSNLVVQPQDWDERGKGVKTDRIDALALCQRLDRYVRGNRKAFSVVRVPSEEEEGERAISRQRGQLVRERQRLQAMGRSLLAMHGIHVTGKWWTGKTWAMIGSDAPAWVVERLKIFIKLIEPVEAEERKLTEAGPGGGAGPEDSEGSRGAEFRGVAPGGWGLVALQQYPALRARSRSRAKGSVAKLSSYTGLCPREHSSGGKRRGGSVNKSGNPRVRAMLVEMVWRMIRWQPEYHALRKWMPVLGDAKGSAAARKKAIVAVARQLAVDLWRLFTGQTTAENWD